jgi:hypothetical protein
MHQWRAARSDCRAFGNRRENLAQALCPGIGIRHGNLGLESLGQPCLYRIKGRGMPAVAAAKYLLSCRAAYKEHSSLEIGTGEDLTGLLKRCQRPFGASDQEWWQVIDDAGRFLDQWGSRAVEFGWTPGDLFDVPNETGKCGLAWFLHGDSVRSLEPDGAFMESGRVFDKLTHCIWKNPRQNGGAQ